LTFAATTARLAARVSEECLQDGRPAQFLSASIQDDLMTTRNCPFIDRQLSGKRPAEAGAFGAQRLLKKGIDLVGAGLLVIALLPVFIMLCIIVLIDDGCPIIYRRRVMGPTGEFDAFKFRTMKRDAEARLARDPDLKAQYQENFKLKNDPRLTASGSFLRKFSLDELPQLFNILKGQMSLVGPRMISPPELEKYSTQKELLLTVKPGLTGYWQVSGRQTVGYNERVKMDLHYINHWSLAMDLKILLKTPYAVFKREGAY
jgi:lipopolysaccharide/colanic/teichoic acid biosynthesis glycosyltransferase